MKCTILQPTYLPWLGYFEMIARSEMFVVFDNVQFSRKSWQQRNRIKTPTGAAFLTVPVKKAPLDTPIKDIQIAQDGENPLTNHWRQISGAYKRAKYFATYADGFAEIYSRKYELLRDLNCDLIAHICAVLGIQANLVFASKLPIVHTGTDKNQDVVDVCKAAGADQLYDARGAQEFLDTDVFVKNGIEITFQNYQHPTYKQLWGNFESHMSVVDLLFNEGPASRDIILSGA